jgi:electron transfer flavoprotein alpha subunit
MLKKVAETLGTTVTAVKLMGDVSELDKYGVDKVLKVNNDKLSGFTRHDVILPVRKM